MGIRSFLGFGSTGSSLSSGSSGTATRTSGMSTTGWHRSDEETARRHHREAQVSLPAAGTDQRGGRVNSADPYSRPDSSTRRNFGRPCREDGGAR
ncbi:hypothetical protein ACIRST_38465 [Kitasatospora sp. NPDC101447]|uniref:hypothetical protein n=1 Tax=Kitasatospora sp. NPDC101447 TaxID=3364102 RepID=UPI00380A755D